MSTAGDSGSAVSPRLFCKDDFSFLLVWSRVGVAIGARLSILCIVFFAIKPDSLYRKSVSNAAAYLVGVGSQLLELAIQLLLWKR